MNRMRRMLTYVSLVVSFAIIFLWVRSYWVGDTLSHRGASINWSAHSSSGVITIARGNVGATSPEWRWKQYPGRFDPMERFWDSKDGPSIPNRIGFGVIVDRYPSAGLSVRPTDVLPPMVVNHFVFIPLWAVLGIFLVLPGMQLYRRVQSYRRVRAARADPYACSNCGYDLRATPERCPECGQPGPVRA